MLKRNAEKEWKSLSEQFKAVTLIGPRQLGKTILSKYVRAEYKKYGQEGLSYGEVGKGIPMLPNL